MLPETSIAAAWIAAGASRLQTTALTAAGCDCPGRGCSTSSCSCASAAIIRTSSRAQSQAPPSSLAITWLRTQVCLTAVLVSVCFTWQHQKLVDRPCNRIQYCMPDPGCSALCTASNSIGQVSVSCRGDFQTGSFMRPGYAFSAEKSISAVHRDSMLNAQPQVLKLFSDIHRY